MLYMKVLFPLNSSTNDDLGKGGLKGQGPGMQVTIATTQVPTTWHHCDTENFNGILTEPRPYLKCGWAERAKKSICICC